MSDELTELPEDWKLVQLKDITSKLVDGSHNPPSKQEVGLPMLSARNINDGKIDFDGECRFIEESAFKAEDARTKISAGDVLLTIVGAIGRAAVVPDSCQPFTLQRSVAVMSPIKIVPSFLKYQFDSPRLQTEFLDKAKGTAQKGIYLKTLSELRIALPPLNEQKRIVAKIEELRDRSHRAKQALEAVPELCDGFRQSVLAAAFRGDLTADWREENPDVEPALVLLERIKERRFELAEKKRDLLAVQKTYAELIDSPVDDPSLPDGWLHCRINDIGNVCNGSTPSRKELKYWDGSIPWVSSGEVRNNEIFQTREAITEEGYENTSVRLLPVSTVLLAMIGEGKTRGQTAILRIEATINQNIAAVILNHGLVLPEYLWYWFQYQYASTREVGSGSGPQALNCQRVREIPFVLAPLQEQKAVVTCIKNMLDSTGAIRHQLQLTVDHLAILNQSILAKAFRGELVEQNPNDEPASVLLDRIRIERQAQEGKKSGGARGKRKKANNDQLDLPRVE
ncbi:restriction endonuclease subunit S [Leptolyngbya sp. GB1-A1]|uniref:restriction endonuclease subunit S n=1 Tax=Leptolyngbya sp. GB1-A1 TaxID=2933908 RepID=UPI00329793AE